MEKINDYYKKKVAELEMRIETLESLVRTLTKAPDKQYYSIKEYADLFSISQQTVYNQIWSGEITAVKIGKAWRIPCKKLEL